MTNKKIVIIGTSGSGKSTLARKLGQKLIIPHIELDTLYWQKNWQVDANFRNKLEKELKGPKWIVCGNYSKVKDLTWCQADLILWLDYPLPLVLWRALKRSFRRMMSQEKICGDNTETIKRFFSKNSIILWIIQTHFKRKKEYQSLISSKEDDHPPLVQIKSSKQLDELISTLIH